MSDTGAKLDVTWSVGDSKVEISYRLTNAGQGSLVVFDRMQWRDEGGRQIPDPHYALVAIARDGSVTVDKLAPPVPDEIDVMSPYMPYGRVISAGEVLEGGALLPLPLAEALAYPLPNPDLPKAATRAVFRLGVAVFPDRWDGPPPFHKAKLIAGEDAVLMRHSWAMMNQQILTSAVSPLKVAVAQSKS